ncbi:zinc-binding dehydrogenase [Saccharicrinis fermentans]|uniref:Sorbitol dehydrogenase n=1 Tax=Saccharicrinis fermentans DSM 9555 = JCM 21142 TaxID=869213 RepID=W7YBJ0_9BACT|nr:zinc-binding dehydrogenase [Saccharicrinis fermentans]GAF05008.1 sorbitol dehydrogenase [Saccharicrinis fermentans DSM 9555 = JCM 21142]
MLKNEVEVGYDVVYECCGKQEALDAALRLLKSGGKLVFVGIPETEGLQFNMNLMRRKEICVQNVRRQNNSFEDAIEMIVKEPSYFERLITHNYHFKAASEAFENVANYEDGVIKAMVEFDDI